MARLMPSAGDADLYVWPPDWTTGAWASINAGTAEDVVAFTAPASGVYQIEVYGYTAASYTLEIAVNPTANVALVKRPAAPANGKTERRAPVVDPRDTPSERMAIPEPPPTVAPRYSVYLPLVLRQ